MKSKKITILSVLVCLFILAGSDKSYAQCSYVITGKSNDTTISIPCDFPVFEETGNQVVYISELTVWDSKNQNVKASDMLSSLEDGKAYIVIPDSDFKKYSSDRQSAINNKDYYKVKE